jgi:hypothetical protein
MNRILLGLAIVSAATPLRAVDKVPAFDVTDSYATSPTMLVRAGIDGELREIWSGMDAGRMRHVPLFLETSIFGQVRRGADWTDLRSLRYTRAGTRPGYIRLQSEDGLVVIEVTSKKNAALSPLFVRYAFSTPVDFRLTAKFTYPEFTREFHSDDGAGSWAFSTLWRGENARLTTMDGPGLVLATLPAGTTLSSGGQGEVKEIDSAREVLLCIDATERRMDLAASQNYVDAWTGILGGTSDTEAEYLPGRVTLETDDPRLDRLFQDSVDAVVSGQFASGDVIGDEFFYRDSWLRDGSYSIIGLSLAGGREAAERYFAFWDAQRDFSVGGEREAQQPAIGLTAMWFYSRLASDGTAFLEKVWPYAKYYCDYYAGRIDREGMLNVAEEWICFIPSPASWPNAEIYSGLRAAAKIAAQLGHGPEAGRWNAAADRLRSEFLARAYDSGKGRIIPMAGNAGQSFADPDFPKAESRNGPLRDDRVDAGMLIIGRLEALGKGQGIIPVDDPRFASTEAEIRRDLENPDHSIFRFGPNPASPHAPNGELDTWPIIISWAAQDEWLLGHTDMAWSYLLSGILNKRGYDLEKGCYYLPENWDRRQFADKPIITWSHGDFLTSTFLLLLGVDLEPDGADLGLAPSLPPGINHARVGNFSFRDWRLDIDLSRSGVGVEVGITAAGAPSVGGPLSIRTPSGQVIRLQRGAAARFAADPGQYYLEFGRSRNAAERASILASILGGEKPAKDPSTMTAAELEAFICRAQADFKPTAQ